MLPYLLVENGLGLTTVSRLLPVITTLSLGRQAVLTLLVLSDLVKGVLLALLVFAVSLLGLRNVHLFSIRNKTNVKTGFV